MYFNFGTRWSSVCVCVCIGLLFGLEPRPRIITRVTALLCEHSIRGIMRACVDIAYTSGDRGTAAGPGREGPLRHGGLRARSAYSSVTRYNGEADVCNAYSFISTPYIRLHGLVRGLIIICICIFII
jgi:hypothetical protein